MKGLFGLLLTSLLTASWNIVPHYSTNLTVENNVLISVNDKTSGYVRIYKNSGATSIGENAFDGCSFTTLMVSNSVRTINDDFPVSMTTLEYTGAMSDINFDVPANVVIKEYACDEGFLNYWSEYIRPNIDGSICNVDKDRYVRMKSLYNSLDPETDLIVVNSTHDGTGTIEDSVNYLDGYFSGANRSQMTEKEISRSVMITLILIIASFGMTSIGLFYFLKDKKVIE